MTTTTKTVALITSVAAAIICGPAEGQNVVFQQAGAMSVSSGPMPYGMGVASTAIMSGRAIAGSPFSATEQRHSLQVLGDGTRIEQTENSQISRDSEGRTRTEATPGGADAPSMVTIQDPVAGATYFLDAARKTANKMPLPKLLNGATLPATLSFSAAAAGPVSGRLSVSAGDAPQIVTLQAGPAITKSAVADFPSDEDLGVQSVNGVLAKGTRTTIDIPVGRIGNDRALQVVNERWYSDELGMIVKSSNSDPRFGTTTYELTNISRAAPDPSLFQIPADYAVNEEKAIRTAIQTK